MKPSGQISKCFDEVVDEFLVSDELRKVQLLYCLPLHLISEMKVFMLC